MDEGGACDRRRRAVPTGDRGGRRRTERPAFEHRPVEQNPQRGAIGSKARQLGCKTLDVEARLLPALNERSKGAIACSRGPHQHILEVRFPSRYSQSASAIQVLRARKEITRFYFSAITISPVITPRSVPEEPQRRQSHGARRVL